MECTICDTEMRVVKSAAEGSFGMDTLWCPNCGTLLNLLYSPEHLEPSRHWDVPNVSKAKGHRGRLDVEGDSF